MNKLKDTKHSGQAKKWVINLHAICKMNLKCWV